MNKLCGFEDLISWCNPVEVSAANDDGQDGFGLLEEESLKMGDIVAFDPPQSIVPITKKDKVNTEPQLFYWGKFLKLENGTYVFYGTPNEKNINKDVSPIYFFHIILKKGGGLVKKIE